MSENLAGQIGDTIKDLPEEDLRVMAGEENAQIVDQSTNGLNSLNSQFEAKPILDPEGFYGLAGEVVNRIDPYTEADPVAVLSTLLEL